MATQQFGYGPGVWAPAKGVGAVAIPKLLQPGAVAPQFKAENKYLGMAAKAIGEMAYNHWAAGQPTDEGLESVSQKADPLFADETAEFDPDVGASYVNNIVPTSPFEPSTTAEAHKWLMDLGILDAAGNEIAGMDAKPIGFDAATADINIKYPGVVDGQEGMYIHRAPDPSPYDEMLGTTYDSSKYWKFYPNPIIDYGESTYDPDKFIYQ